MVFKRKTGTKKTRKQIVRKVDFTKQLNKALLKSNIIEQKRHRGVMSVAVSTTPSVLPLLSGNTQGLGDLNVRTGDEISLSKITFHYSCQLADTTNMVRLIMFLWNDTNTTAPVGGDVFDDSTNITTILFGGINEDNLKAKRLRILYDKRIPLYNSKNYMSGSITKVFNIAQPVVFSGGSSTICRFMPYVCLVSDSSAISHPDFNAYHITHYTDL